MSYSKRILDEQNREEPREEYPYGVEMEQWPSDGEITQDADNA